MPPRRFSQRLGLAGADATLAVLTIVKPRPTDDPGQHHTWRLLVNRALDEKLAEREHPAPPLSGAGPRVEDGPQHSPGPCATTRTPPAAGTPATG